MSSENNRRSHRAVGPVDTPVTSAARDVKDSPRRLARQAQEEARRREAALREATQRKDVQKDAEVPGANPDRADSTKEGGDLFTKWLQANGFSDLQNFQNRLKEAEEEHLRQTRPHGLPQVSLPNPRRVAPTEAAPRNPANSVPNVSRAAATALPALLSRTGASAAAVVAPPLPQAAPQPQNPQKPQKPQKPQASQPKLSQPPKGFHTAAPQACDQSAHRATTHRAASAAPTQATTPSPTTPSPTAPKPQTPVLHPGKETTPATPTTPPTPATTDTTTLEAAKPHTKRPLRRRRKEKPVAPKPLEKSLRVPILLTSAVLALLAIVLVLAVIWYRAQVTPQDEDTAQIQVLGAIGAQPVLTLSAPLPLEDASSELLIKGNGRQVEPGDIAALRVTVFSGYDGDLVTTDAGTSIITGEVSDQVLGSELYNLIKGGTEGSRYLLKHPVTTSQGASRMEIGVVDLIPSVLQGQMQDLPAESHLGISVGESGLPTPVINGNFDGNFRADTLIAGKGAAVETGQTVLVRYAEYSYSNPAVLLKDHWSQPVKLKMDSTVQPGVARGIVDQKVGSRVVLQIPPADGSGDQPTILVVDILAAWDNPKVVEEL